MKLYHGEVEVCEVMTNHSMSVDDVLALMDIDMDEFAKSNGWDDWDPAELRLEY